MTCTDPKWGWQRRTEYGGTEYGGLQIGIYRIRGGLWYPIAMLLFSPIGPAEDEKDIMDRMIAGLNRRQENDTENHAP